MKRKVEINIGDPKAEPVEGIAHPSECYFIRFIEEDDEQVEELSAQMTCLCPLNRATKAWLNGDSEDEIMELMTSHEHE